MSPAVVESVRAPGMGVEDHPVIDIAMFCCVVFFSVRTVEI